MPSALAGNEGKGVHAKRDLFLIGNALLTGIIVCVSLQNASIFNIPSGLLMVSRGISTGFGEGFKVLF